MIDLRNRHNDFDGYAREILSETLNYRSSSNAQKLRPSTADLDVHGNRYPDSSVFDFRTDHNECEGEQINQQPDDEAALMSFLGSEDHYKLMAEISEVLQAEYQELMDEYDINDYENGELLNQCERLQDEAELNESEYLICPICR